MSKSGSLNIALSRILSKLQITLDLKKKKSPHSPGRNLMRKNKKVDLEILCIGHKSHEEIPSLPSSGSRNVALSPNDFDSFLLIPFFPVK